MLEPTYLLLCSKVVVDRDTGAMSFIELIDMARVPGPLPLDRLVVVPLEFYVVSGWRRDDTTRPLTFPVRFALFGPTGERRDLGEQQVRLDPNHLGTAGARVHGLPLRGPGQYRVGVEWLDPHEAAWKPGPWAGLWIPTVEETIGSISAPHTPLEEDLVAVLKSATGPLAAWDVLDALQVRVPDKYTSTDLTTATVSTALQDLVRRGVAHREKNGYILQQRSDG
jgi:hypothetical protein